MPLGEAAERSPGFLLRVSVNLTETQKVFNELRLMNPTQQLYEMVPGILDLSLLQQDWTEIELVLAV